MPEGPLSTPDNITVTGCVLLPNQWKEETLFHAVLLSSPLAWLGHLLTSPSTHLQGGGLRRKVLFLLHAGILHQYANWINRVKLKTDESTEDTSLQEDAPVTHVHRWVSALGWIKAEPNITNHNEVSCNKDSNSTGFLMRFKLLAD